MTDGSISAFTLLKNLYSVCLLIFSVVIVMGLIFSGQTKIASEVNPWVAFIVIWAALLWLSMVEGGQGALVGLAPINFDLYKDTHPKTYMSTKIAHVGDNLDRYLLGRQFMVLFIVFSTNMAGAPLPNSQLWGFPDWVITIFLGTGIAMILMTNMIGQLNTQVNAAHCMLDYINSYFAVFTFYVAMAIEFSGLLHSSYVIQIIVGLMAGKNIESNEPPRSGFVLLFFWLRCLASIAILFFCLAVTIEALFAGQTTMWEGVPNGLAVVLFFVLMSVVGLLEGMQIAFFAVTKLRESERGSGVFAKRTCELLFRGDGHNLPGFMIGRQITVTLNFFVIARVTSLNIVPGKGENVFGVSDAMQEFFNTGLLGALITTILASIAWQLVASAFPIAFLSNPIVYVFLVLALLLEGTGVCNGAWVLAAIHKQIAGYQRDEVYIGTAEERAQRNMEDKPVAAGAGHIFKLPGFVDMPEALEALMLNDPTVAEFIRKISQHSELEMVEEESRL
mmetsp:Transcript_51914/g.62410  ORF Transcript_51914/g.62410 Transcript_51914/m.62410 type:complete len:505 (-) Transcript_51914:211-1725(-)|eukprot:CAMPEP_0172484370 /NCGR_PEP_ID=MMETSP1066-20121228/11811_1 /TAXON_ID=671091 /ORGANISM="Coscinodiscus wailesii, Strain CCMP2513" /LENGTH=504 /DNA_ID=CAMNT_0013248841 /DNA_START=118 /DNA_END=1632 /DNA_ORIENTATION=-